MNKRIIAIDTTEALDKCMNNARLYKLKNNTLIMYNTILSYLKCELKIDKNDTLLISNSLDFTHKTSKVLFKMLQEHYSDVNCVDLYKNINFKNKKKEILLLDINKQYHIPYICLYKNIDDKDNYIKYFKETDLPKQRVVFIRANEELDNYVRKLPFHDKEDVSKEMGEYILKFINKYIIDKENYYVNVHFHDYEPYCKYEIYRAIRSGGFENVEYEYDDYIDIMEEKIYFSKWFYGNTERKYGPRITKYEKGEKEISF